MRSEEEEVVEGDDDMNKGLLAYTYIEYYHDNKKAIHIILSEAMLKIAGPKVTNRYYSSYTRNGWGW